MKRLLDQLRRRISLRTFNRVGAAMRGVLEDTMAPRGDHLHIILKSRGDAQDAIYVDDTREYRSPALQEGQAADASIHRNP